MIFKYYLYNGAKKSWEDSKSYLSICSDLTSQTIYNALVKKKFISDVNYDDFSVANNSTDSIKQYLLYRTLNNGKRGSFGKIYQLHGKEHANIFGMLNNKLMLDTVAAPLRPYISTQSIRVDDMGGRLNVTLRAAPPTTVRAARTVTTRNYAADFEAMATLRDHEYVDVDAIRARETARLMAEQRRAETELRIQRNRITAAYDDLEF